MGRGVAGGRGDRAGAPVVSDASPLIALDRIGRLDLLRDVFGQIIIPSAVASEVGPTTDRDWIVERRPSGAFHRRVVAARLHAGETEAITLALEVGAGRIVLDDGPARRVALTLELVVVGTAGVLLTAKRLGILPDVAPVLALLLTSGFRLRPEVIRQVLVRAGEAG